LLVSHVDAFVDYQQSHAWTWEHQALLKARLLTGNSAIKKAFQQLKKRVMAMPRDSQELQEKVLAMRAKIKQNRDSDALKYTKGGLLDLEFLVQFLLLNLSDPKLSRYTHTLSQLKQLYLAQVVTEEQYEVLKKAYRRYHHYLHQNILQSAGTSNDELYQQVGAICDAIYSKFN